ncbi:MAG: cobalamin-binding protein [Gammaproteobacteria bacterium]|nr:cobalamin-binding protein [Gammaproteobacteria bacterium]
MKLFFTLIFTIFISHFVHANNSQRIIALSPHSVEILYAIGAGKQIVATLSHADYPKQARQIPIIGNYHGIQIEKVLDLKPDLIIAWKTGNKIQDLKRLESLGYKIFYSNPQTIDEVSADISKIAKLIHQQKNTEQVIKKLETEYQYIKALYSNKKRVDVFYQLWHSPLRTIGSNNWINSLINDCGGNNIFANSTTTYPMISMENLLSKNPQLVIIPVDFKADNINKTELELWSKWQHIAAVKNKHIYQIDSDLLHRQTPRAVEGLSELCKLIDLAR